ncbi:MAG: MarR family transcriptional regulator [Candidatus Diapherotrites archaeon]|nr:MarR family transcriptional regulator [Candidatus Diapherotrites archaeon]
MTLKKILDARYLNNLSPKSKKVLLEITNHHEITNKTLSNKLKTPSSNISTYIKNLNEQGCVYLRRKNGKDKFWSADPIMKWNLLEVDEGLLKDEGYQDTLLYDFNK